MPQMCEWTFSGAICTKVGADQLYVTDIYIIFHSCLVVLTSFNHKKRAFAHRLRTSFYAKSRVITAWKGSPHGLFGCPRVPLWQHNLAALSEERKRNEGELHGVCHSQVNSPPEPVFIVKWWLSLEQCGTSSTLTYSVSFKVTSNVVLSCRYVHWSKQLTLEAVRLIFLKTNKTL